MSHCVKRLFRSRMGITSVRSGVGSFFFGGGLALLFFSLGPPPKPSRSLRPPRLRSSGISLP